ncbi:MAG: BatD family protein, partial [Spirochaetota bacterium]
MVCKSRSRRFGRPAGLVVLLLAAALSAHAQVTATLSEQTIAVGERVSYIITIDHEEPGDVEIRSPDFPALRVVEGPTIRPVSILTGSERQRAVEVRFTFEAEEAGRYVLPAVPVSVAGQPYLTNVRLIEIGERRNRARVPFLARWVGPERALHAGEARVFTLEIYNVPEYLYPSSVSVGAPQNA